MTWMNSPEKKFAIAGGQLAELKSEVPRRFYVRSPSGCTLRTVIHLSRRTAFLASCVIRGSLRYFKSGALQKLLGDLSVDINNIRYRNDHEYQFFASPLKPFLLKHFDFDWLDQLRNEDTSPEYR